MRVGQRATWSPMPIRTRRGRHGCRPSRRRPARSSRCCRRRTPPATGSRWCSACRCASRSWNRPDGYPQLRAGMTVTVIVDTGRSNGLPRFVQSWVDKGYLRAALQSCPPDSRPAAAMSSITQAPAEASGADHFLGDARLAPLFDRLDHRRGRTAAHAGHVLRDSGPDRLGHHLLHRRLGHRHARPAAG